MVTQQQIDTEGYNGKEVIEVDPIGGGVDVLYRVGILDVITSNPYSRRLVQWKPSNDVPDVVPGEGWNDNVHFIGIAHGEGERFAFVECPEAGSYTLEIPSFSEVSDEIVVRRVFCAALRPTSAGFTFSNPIADVAVPASPDTVTLQTVALDELKTVKSTDTITLTHTQDFPCVFGICYKHKVKGEIDGGGSEPTSVEITVPNTDLIRFSAKEPMNYLRAVVYIHSGTLSGIYLSTTDGSKRLYRLRISYTHSAQGMFETIHDDIVVNSDNMRIGGRLDLQGLFNTRMHYKIFDRAELDIELTTEELADDLFLRLIYTNDYSNNG